MGSVCQPLCRKAPSFNPITNGGDSGSAAQPSGPANPLSECTPGHVPPAQLVLLCWEGAALPPFANCLCAVLRLQSKTIVNQPEVYKLRASPFGRHLFFTYYMLLFLSLHHFHKNLKQVKIMLTTLFFMDSKLQNLFKARSIFHPRPWVQIVPK